MSSMIGRFFLAFGVLACLGLGSCMGWSSFERIARMRELERVPPTTAIAALPGEINITGKVEIAEKSLTSPNRKRECAYYRYHVEREERDSDGDTRWVTVKDERRFVSFWLADDTGKVRVQPAGKASWSVDKDWSVTRGKMRYTEYRLDPGDSLFCFGFAERDARPDSGTPGGVKVGFQRDGRYSPIISQAGEHGERNWMATASVFLCWGALVALSFAIVFGCFAAQIHRLFVYLVLVASVLGFGLTFFGVTMIGDDLTSAKARLQRHREEARKCIGDALKQSRIDWNGDWTKLGSFRHRRYAAMDDALKQRVDRVRLDLARAVVRTNKVRSGFPEWVLAPGFGVGVEQELPMPDAEHDAAAELDSAFQPARLPSWVALLLGVLGLLCGVLLTRFGFRTARVKRLIENIPTSPTAGAAWGPLELAGHIEQDDEIGLLSGPLSDRECVQYHYVVKEKRGSGKNSRWVTITDREERAKFYCVDREGRLLVDPSGAEIFTRHSDSQSRGNRRYTETRLEPGDPVYALGYAKVAGPEADHLMLQAEEDFPYLLGNVGEREVMLRKSRSGLMQLNIALCSVVLVGLVLLGAIGSLGATDYLAAALVAPLYLAALYTFALYNDLVFLRNRVDQTWSNIDVALQKRHDLVPQLEAVVKRYMSHEKGLLEKLATARATGGRADNPDEAGPAVVPELLGVVERYPDLKSDENARELMHALTRIENEVALMRHGYNQATESYNARIAHFPELLIARAGKFERVEPFRAGFEVHHMPELGF